LTEALNKARELRPGGPPVPVVVIPNATAGGTALSPLNLKNFNKHSGHPPVKVLPIKQPSSDAKLDSLDPEPISHEALQTIFEDPPIVLIADFNKGGKFPRSFQLYKNLAALINTAWGKDNHEQWAKAGLDTTPFVPDPARHGVLVAQAKDLASRYPAPQQGLEMHYASVNGKILPTEFKEKIGVFKWDLVTGPGFIAVQTAFTEADMREAARGGDSDAIAIMAYADEHGLTHQTGLFDDDSHAQDPKAYPDEQGFTKFNPLAHPPSRDNFNAMKEGTFQGPAKSRSA